MIHPASMLAEGEGQIRRAWSEFAVTWAAVEPGWRDDKRQHWERQVIESVPGIISLTTSAISELREASIQCLADLADPANSSEGL